MNQGKPTYGVAMSEENIKAERYRPITEAFLKWHSGYFYEKIDEHDAYIGFSAGWKAAMKYMEEKNGSE